MTPIPEPGAATPAPWVSVVIPTCNDGEALARAVASVTVQNDPGAEIVVVDDGSTDATPALIDALRAATPGLVALRQANAGPSAARNAGLRVARGRYLLFLDADDRLLPDALQRFRAALDARPVDMLFGGRIEVFAGRRRTTPQPPLTGDRARDFADFVTRRRPTVALGCAVLARRVFDRLAWPEDLRVAEDLVLHAQILALYDCACLPDPVAEIGEDSARTQRRGLERWRDLLATVDRLFDPTLLPADMMALRPLYEGLIHLRLFRVFQLAGQAPRALPHYRRAVALAPRRALKPRYIARAAAAAWAAWRGGRSGA